MPLFAGAKQALLSATHLAHPSVGAELSVVVDASPTPWHGCQTLGQLVCPGILSYVAEYTWDICHIAGAAKVVADTFQASPGQVAAGGPPLVATYVKLPSWSQIVALQGGKLNSSPPSLPGVADGQPAVGISFTMMAANQANCPSTLKAIKSSSLTVRLSR